MISKTCCQVLLLTSGAALRRPFIIAAGHICNIIRQLGEAFITCT